MTKYLLAILGGALAFAVGAALYYRGSAANAAAATAKAHSELAQALNVKPGAGRGDRPPTSL